MKKRSKVPYVRDLTNVQTVYTARLRTLRVKLRTALATATDVELLTISSKADLTQVLEVIFATLDDDQEHFIILILNAANELIGYKVIASGAQDHVHIDPKQVFRNALLLGANSIILAHNHPSGKATPSAQDIALTGQLRIGGELLHLSVLDHLIYTKKEQISLRDCMPALFGDRDPAAESETKDPSKQQ
ncbi:MAG: JAB domain-containing protein [Proteobacteria bacterium]|nr:JAB domain-containing protein [Pseudomonadota bacterium]